MKVIKKKVSNFIKMLSIKQLYFTAVLPLYPYCIFRPECLLSPDKKHTYLGNAKRYYE